MSILRNLNHDFEIQLIHSTIKFTNIQKYNCHVLILLSICWYDKLYPEIKSRLRNLITFLKTIYGTSKAHMYVYNTKCMFVRKLRLFCSLHELLLFRQFGRGDWGQLKHFLPKLLSWLYFNPVLIIKAFQL